MLGLMKIWVDLQGKWNHHLRLWKKKVITWETWSVDKSSFSSSHLSSWHRRGSLSTRQPYFYFFLIITKISLFLVSRCMFMSILMTIGLTGSKLCTKEPQNTHFWHVGKSLFLVSRCRPMFVQTYEIQITRKNNHLAPTLPLPSVKKRFIKLPGGCFIFV